MESSLDTGAVVVSEGAYTLDDVFDVSLSDIVGC
jgi:hypothetical protein